MTKKLTDEQIRSAAEAAGLEYSALKAVAAVESRGSGFLPDGQPVILFEGHIFWRQLVAVNKNPNDYLFGNENILHQKRDQSKYKGGAAEHARLQQAAKIDREAALKSASWGLFQVMGFNYSLCGFRRLQDFINAMYRSEADHLEAALGYIRSAGLLPALKRLDWPAFAKGYNGSGYAANQYDVKLAREYAAAKQKGW